MPKPEEPSAFIQMMKQAADALKREKKYTVELNSLQLPDLIKEVLTSLKNPAVKKTGLVTVEIAEPGEGETAKAKIQISGLEGEIKMIFGIPFTLNSIKIEMANSDSKTQPPGQERLQVLPNIQTDPSKIMTFNVPDLLNTKIGGEQINQQLGDVFAKQLQQRKVALHTYGFMLTDHGTLQVSLTAK